jgi:electron transfer flavoprotein alpha subunit
MRRLASTLAVLEQRDGKLNPSSLAAISAAQKLGGSIHGFLAGANAKTSAEEAAKVPGLEKVIFVDNAAYDKGLPENYAPLLIENVKKGGYTHILAGHSAFGKNLLPRVAALLDVQQISDITAIESEDTFVRPIYAGNAILTVQSSDSTKEEFDRVIPPLADALGAAIGASRAAVDSGFADNSLQVGQTGKNVAPQLYLCAGISGAIQHLAGMKDSKVIAAINKDADAPIFQVADVGLVGDLFEKVPELTEKLKSA